MRCRGLGLLCLLALPLLAPSAYADSVDLVGRAGVPEILGGGPDGRRHPDVVPGMPPHGAITLETNDIAGIPGELDTGDILEDILPPSIIEVSHNDLHDADILNIDVIRNDLNNDLTTTVPEPSTLALVATGLVGGWLRKRQVMART